MVETLYDKAIAATQWMQRAIPTIEWWKYAATRLGTGIMTYFAFTAFTVLSLTLMGFNVGIGLVFGIIPLAIFIAVRVSHAFTSTTKRRR